MHKRHIWPFYASNVREGDYVVLWQDYGTVMVIRVDEIEFRWPGEYRFIGQHRWAHWDGSAHGPYGPTKWFKHNEWLTVITYRH